MRDQIVIGIWDQDSRRNLLKVQGLTLQRSTNICRAAEIASVLCQDIRSEEAHVIKIYDAYSNATKKECLFYGYVHEPKREKCPIYGQSCKSCHERNRFEFKFPNKKQRHYKEIDNQSRKKIAVKISHGITYTTLIIFINPSARAGYDTRSIF